MQRLGVVLGALALAGGALGAAGAAPVKLPKPAFAAAAAQKPAPPGAPRLVLVSSRRNAITDIPEWFANNGLTLREYGVPGALGLGPDLPALPELVPATIRDGTERLVRAIRQKRVLLLVYGPDFSDGRVLIASDPAGSAPPRIRYGFDFASYGAPPGPAGEEGLFQQVLWAAEVGGILYVANAHRTYASSSRGLNAYLTAIDVKRRRVIWRNGPLLANAHMFDVVGNYIVSGYGFTAEPDFLYLLDRRDGKVIQRLAVPSAPEYIIRSGRKIFVRTYDHDLVVELRAG